MRDGAALPIQAFLAIGLVRSDRDMGARRDYFLVRESEIDIELSHHFHSLLLSSK
jgi:hypothetical protein